MPESSIVVRPEPMESGSYTASSRLQAAGLRDAIKLFEEAAAAVPVPRLPQPFVIADYGASTGHNSLLPIGAAIAVLRKRTRTDHPTLVVHTDVPGNDFTALFRTLAEDPDTYLSKDAAAFASAIGRSFYSQIMPSSSVNLGWSSWAIHWLSRVPGPIPDHLHVAYSSDERVRDAYARQAAQDWQEFIAFRGRELCRGGRLLVVTAAVDEDGDSGYRPLLGALIDTIDELVAERLLTTDEVYRMGIPIVGRRESDFLAPFAPKGRFEQLEIEHLEILDAGDRFWQQYEVDGNADAFGAQWSAFCRAAVFPTLVSALECAAGDPRPTAVIDRLEAGLATRLAAAPEKTRIPMAYLVLTKRPKTT